MFHFIRTLACAMLFATAFSSGAVRAEVWNYKQDFLPHLVKAVPGILASQDPATGRFGKGIWIVTDQNQILPLAAAWSIKDPANPYYHDPKVLEAVMDGGDALIDDQDEKGMWEFRKKDGSTWGKIYMPWTYSRWIRAYELIRESMPPERREKWEKALRLGFEGIEKNEFTHIHNIPAHHAMGLYIAGHALNRPDWSTTAAAFLRRVADTQFPDGFWSENVGPVVGYNMVYTDALGVYYGLSRDLAVLPVLERAARFHANFTYPDGSAVETVDERQVYHRGTSFPNVGFTHTAEGRGYLHRQYERLMKKNAPLSTDVVASHLLYGSVGEETPAPVLGERRDYVQTDGKAAVRRQGSWFTCLSAYTSPVPEGRWIQDRQNLVSLFHDKTGLILGGGNTKLQPLWSTFTEGDVNLLKHKPGDEEPNFIPPPGIIHIPTSATLDGEAMAISLNYGGALCRVQVELSETSSSRLIYSLDSATTLPVEAHLPLIADVGDTWQTASGKEGKLGEEGWTLKPGEAGEWFAHNGWKISLPKGAGVTWPVYPHNPYRKDGSPQSAEEGRIVVTLPFGQEPSKQVVTVTVP